MGERRYVYVVEQGMYSNNGIIGVYASPEAAIAANPVPTSTKNKLRDGGWQQHRDSADAWWDNGYDWDDSMRIARFEVEG